MKIKYNFDRNPNNKETLKKESNPSHKSNSEKSSKLEINSNSVKTQRIHSKSYHNKQAALQQPTKQDSARDPKNKFRIR